MADLSPPRDGQGASEALFFDPRVLHFLGHGEMDGLWFEREDGSGERIPTNRIVRLLKGSPVELADMVKEFKGRWKDPLEPLELWMVSDRVEVDPRPLSRYFHGAIQVG